MKKLYSFSIALIVLLLMAASSSAAPSDIKPNQILSHVNGDGARSSFECYGDYFQIGGGNVDVFKSSNGEDAMLTLEFCDWTDEYDPAWCYYNGPIDGNNVVVKAKSISLEVLQLPVQCYDYDGDYTEYIDVKFIWTKDGVCTSKVNSVTTSYGTTYKENKDISSASLTGSINGIDISSGYYPPEIVKVNSIEKLKN